MMSDVDGIYNKPPWEDGARMIHTYTSKERDQVQFGQKSKVSTIGLEYGLFIDKTSKRNIEEELKKDFKCCAFAISVK